MERYRIRPGVVLTSVCGETFLVAAKAARKFCPYFSQLNESSAFLWRKLSDSMTAEDLTRVVLAEYEVEDPASLKDVINSFLSQMVELGYLLREGNEHEE